MAAPKIRNVVVISDLSVGYGTPQILNLSASLAEHYSASVTILEPDQPERPRIDVDMPGVRVERIFTVTHPYSEAGRVEYNLGVVRQLDEIRPDIVVLCSFMGAAALERMKHRPLLTIFYGLEHSNGANPALYRLFSWIAPRIDLAVFPEENRAVLDAPRLGLARTPRIVIYNGSNVRIAPRSHADRNGRYFYGGLLHPELTYSDYFLGGRLRNVPIDLYGIIDGYQDKDEVLERFRAHMGRMSYRGYVATGAAYMAVLSEYLFSLVIWAPLDEATRFAAPNKLFDAIQAGVPVITAPHPQCERIVNRYKCGIVLRGWGFDDLVAGLQEADSMVRSGQYADLVANCVTLARPALTWPAQARRLCAETDRILAVKSKAKAF